jgi:predicted nucleotide-binding protein (sugar kinase/HSP70/actin superfamily)
VFAGFAASDLLHAALLDVRPCERVLGQAQAIHDAYAARLYRQLEEAAAGDLSLHHALWQTASGRLFGVRRLLEEAAAAFAAARNPGPPPPTVLLVGEIYARCNDFANDQVTAKLEACGLRVKLAPFGEWLEYADFAASLDVRPVSLTDRVKQRLQRGIRRTTHRAMAGPLGWPDPVPAHELVAAARDYLPDTLYGEAVLTVGNALHEWRAGRIAAVLSVGPHECMPSRIAEAQFIHAAEREQLPSLSLPLNGDPVDPEVLETFAFAIRRKARSPEGCGARGC